VQVLDSGRDRELDEEEGIRKFVVVEQNRTKIVVEALD